MKLVIKKTSGEVVMRSDGPIKVDANLFDVVDHEPSKDEIESFERNRPARYAKSGITFEESHQEIAEKKIEALEDLKKVAEDFEKPMEERLQAVIDITKKLS
jgi:regulatory protein YycI of two-component signal transduction system YycFG